VIFDDNYGKQRKISGFLGRQNTLIQTIQLDLANPSDGIDLVHDFGDIMVVDAFNIHDTITVGSGIFDSLIGLDQVPTGGGQVRLYGSHDDTP
jgi:hypothetical protein